MVVSYYAKVYPWQNDKLYILNQCSIAISLSHVELLVTFDSISLFYSLTKIKVWGFQQQYDKNSKVSVFMSQFVKQTNVLKQSIHFSYKHIQCKLFYYFKQHLTRFENIDYFITNNNTILTIVKLNYTLNYTLLLSSQYPYVVCIVCYFWNWIFKKMSFQRCNAFHNIRNIEYNHKCNFADYENNCNWPDRCAESGFCWFQCTHIFFSRCQTPFEKE